MDQINMTKLQESLYDFYRLYNLSFAVSVVICPALEWNLVQNEETDGIDGASLESQKETDRNPFHSFVQLFSFFFEDTNSSSFTKDEEGSQKMECVSILEINSNQRFSTLLDFCLLISFSCFFIWFVICVLKCIFGRMFSRKVMNQEYIANDSEESKENVVVESSCINANSVIHKVVEPLTVSFPFEHSNELVKISIDQVFESTLPIFLRQLDTYLGFEIQHFIDERHAKSSSTTLSVPLPSSDTILQSPRVRKKWSHPQDLTPSILRNSYTNEKNLRNWLVFETLCKRLNWLRPRYLQNNFYSKQLKDKDETLNILLTFLQDNCVTKLVDWNVSVLVVNYSVFLIDQMLKHSSENEISNDALRLIRFESMGSAADGSTVGKPDHFDVMFVFEFNQPVDLNVVHNNCCDDISPGHVVLGVKNVDNKNILKTNNCLYKSQIQDKFGFYLQVNQIEEMVDGMVRKAVRKLNTSHKYKMERLPFKLNMSSTKKLELIIDTRLFNGMGIELFNISVKIIPSICIESAEFGFLPKLYAVPTFRADHRKSWEGKEKREGALSKLFPRNNISRLPSSLLWNISVTRLEMDIKFNKEDVFYKSNKESCHFECLMILKGLFCSKNKSSLLSKGEISSYILSTVVNFLLMESSSSAWKMSHLGDRVSDAVHFLRCAYTNVWLPNFVIHNPHLVKKVPVLHVFSSLLKGRQQNLLADINTNEALQTLAFIESRLTETGLHKFIKDEYSEDMWEYEFFLFG